MNKFRLFALEYHDHEPEKNIYLPYKFIWTNIISVIVNLDISWISTLHFWIGCCIIQVNNIFQVCLGNNNNFQMCFLPGLDKVYEKLQLLGTVLCKKTK